MLIAAEAAGLVRGSNPYGAKAKVGLIRFLLLPIAQGLY